MKYVLFILLFTATAVSAQINVKNTSYADFNTVRKGCIENDEMVLKSTIKVTGYIEYSKHTIRVFYRENWNTTVDINLLINDAVTSKKGNVVFYCTTDKKESVAIYQTKDVTSYVYSYDGKIKVLELTKEYKKL